MLKQFKSPFRGDSSSSKITHLPKTEKGFAQKLLSKLSLRILLVMKRF
ncbi:hypothetical protein B4123_0552 [Bacillus paralicheniformis]|nr:hypothetical protein B4123_2528 [Bacillus paralicheniformis]OLG13130.1 hypothetical protein B4123_0552 [Bacillus paralicheniformis]TWJ52123.1 hypothetical protein CHCC5023_4244 [Bacillus paralicheniformis]TWJ70692.1 hypothetical protein CHCC5019_3753 [Bacillus paralicheniformis]TWK91945.1 hypothetical protein CHCC20333_1535 [Bacillus paralicheniformis]